jgi:hypothetical protein
MTSGEKIGAALAKAVKSAAAEWKKGEQAPVMYHTNLRDVPKVDGLKRDDGWIDMQESRRVLAGRWPRRAPRPCSDRCAASTGQ